MAICESGRGDGNSARLYESATIIAKNERMNTSKKENGNKFVRNAAEDRIVKHT